MHSHRSDLKSSFHVVLRYGVFSEMCRDDVELLGFKKHIVDTMCAMTGTKVEKYLVAVKYDGVVVCYHSNDFTLLPESEVFFRWKVFTDKAEALSYHQAVTKMDLKKLLPPSPIQKSQERYVKSFDKSLFEVKSGNVPGLPSSKYFYAYLDSYIFPRFNRSILLGQLSDDIDYLHEFIRGHLSPVSDDKQLHLIILRRDFAVVKHDASDMSQSETFMGLICIKSEFYGWKLFKEFRAADEFGTKLSHLDTKSPLAPIGLAKAAVSSVVAPSTGAINNGTNNSAASTLAPVRNPYASPPSGVRFGGVGGNGKGTSSASGPGGIAPIDLSTMNFTFDPSRSSSGNNGFRINVSGAIPHVNGHSSFAICTMAPIEALYHLSAEFVAMPIKEYADQFMRKRGNPVPLFMETIKDMPVCITSDPHNYNRTKSGWTKNVIFWVVEIPDNLATFEAYVKHAASCIASNYKDGGLCGSNYAAFLQRNKPKLYLRETGMSTAGKKLSNAQFAQSLQTKLVRGFQERTYQWQVPLDSILTYGHIKEFLSGICGYTHWGQVPVHVKGNILTVATVAYPVWEEIEIKPLRADS